MLFGTANSGVVFRISPENMLSLADTSEGFSGIQTDGSETRHVQHISEIPWIQFKSVQVPFLSPCPFTTSVFTVETTSWYLFLVTFDETSWKKAASI